MVQLSIFAVIFAAVATVAADGYCQCLFPDDSHCCVVQYGIHKDCVAMCKDNGNYKKQCNAGGKYKDVGGWHAQWRTSCVNEFV